MLHHSSRVLVTGASGFVGAHLVLGLQRNGFDVVAVGGSKQCAPEVRKGVRTIRNVDLAQFAQTEELLCEIKLKVADVFGYERGLVKPVKQKDVPSNVLRPQDVSLSIARFRARYRVEISDTAQGLKHLRDHYGTDKLLASRVD